MIKNGYARTILKKRYVLQKNVFVTFPIYTAESSEDFGNWAWNIRSKTLHHFFHNFSFFCLFWRLDGSGTDVLGCWRSILIFDNGERLSHRRGAFCSFSFLLIDSNEIKYLEWLIFANILIILKSSNIFVFLLSS